MGCDLTVAVPSWTCASSRTLKENYEPVNGEDGGKIEDAIKATLDAFGKTFA